MKKLFLRSLVTLNAAMFFIGVNPLKACDCDAPVNNIVATLGPSSITFSANKSYASTCGDYGLRVEIKPIASAFNGTTNLYDGTFINSPGAVPLPSVTVSFATIITQVGPSAGGYKWRIVQNHPTYFCNGQWVENAGYTFFACTSTIDNDNDGWVSDCDCNDNNAAINYGVAEICGNGVDDNCDGLIDIFDGDGDGYSVCSGDCNDTNPNVYPGAPEICDGLDNDCNGIVETTNAYNITAAGTNINGINSCGPGNSYSVSGGSLTLTWTSTNANPITSGTISFSQGVDCSSAIHSVFLNGVLQTTFPARNMCTCSNTALPTVIILSPANYISNGVNTISISTNNPTFGLRERPEFGAGVYANVCVQYQAVCTAPVITCPDNIITNNTTGQCGANVTFTATATGTSPIITYSPASGSFFAVGTTTVTATATNDCGSSACTFTVTVNDVDNPTFTCPENDDVDLNGDCELIVPDLITGLTGNDNCGTVTFTQSPAAGTTLSSSHNQTHNVVITADDGNDNTEECTVVLTGKDVSKPTFTCPANDDVELNSTCKLAVPDLITGLTGTDNCGTVTFTQSPVAGTVLPSSHNQLHNIVITAEDGNGNTEECTVVLTSKDVNKPTFICPENDDVDLNSSCKLIVPDLITGLTGTDNCGTVTFTQNPAAGTVLSSSHNQLHNVVITADDGNENTEECTVVLTGKDVNKPTFTCPENDDVELNGSCKLIVPDLITGLTGNDNCGTVTFTQSPSAGTGLSSSHNRLHNVVITADDGNGNTEQCTVVLTGKDVSKPSFTCPANRNLDLNGNCKLVVPDLITGLAGTDNCGTVSFTQSPEAGTALSSSHNQLHNVVVTADDGNGNTEQCTVVLTGKDVSKPSFTCPANRNVELNSSCKLAVPDLITGLTGNDNCGTVTFIQSPAAGTALSSSHNQTHNVVITANDGNGNTSECTVVLTGKDVTKPTITCAPAVSVYADVTKCFATISLIPPFTSDNCGVGTVTSTATATFPLGTTTVTWTVTDLNGNMNTCNQQVTVLANIEICNGLDEDCDGLIDEGFPNTDGDSMADCVDPDDDNDGVSDAADNCPLVANANQANNDGDAQGDVCDPDDDNDGVLDGVDNCPKTANANQKDTDRDGRGDVCDTSCGKDNDKVRICHKGNEICVSAKDVQDHLNHGDYIGPCSYAPCEDKNDFSKPVVLSPTQAPGKWYTDRFAPAGFVSGVNYLGDKRLKHSIGAANKQTAANAFYNTQGRKYDLTNGTTYMEIELYIPLAWKTTGRRMAGFWGTTFDAFNNISSYPIIEFTSEAGPARFRGYNNGIWIDMGLPAGFTYNKWVTLSIELLPTGEFKYRIENLQAVTNTLAIYNSKRIGNVILQGHNTATGVSYDIYWDDFAFRCYKSSGDDDDDDEDGDDRPITSANGVNTNLGNNNLILPKDFRLSSYPNPFAGKSTISYELPYDSKVSIKVYDVMGRVVAHLVNAEKKAGIHTAEFNAGGISKGFLYYKIVAQSKDKRFEQTKKMIHIQ